ncbi:uncharacterized protein OCT59_017287 [Rhizophagus irregularis]|uniref:uncharacterized protein n=1 Tax=Rhizophagus irregularis TaxID=588596 RepID=UPI0033197000|nr:hypothetical protein OCT59_017287 [Rhizophagus irregularis]
MNMLTDSQLSKVSPIARFSKYVSKRGSGSGSESGSESNPGSSLEGASGSGSNESGPDGISKSGLESISSEGCLKGGCGSEGSLESSLKSGSASRSEGLENSSDGSNLCDKEFILKSCEYSERFSLKGSEYDEKEYKS